MRVNLSAGGQVTERLATMYLVFGGAVVLGYALRRMRVRVLYYVKSLMALDYSA